MPSTTARSALRRSPPDELSEARLETRPVSTGSAPKPKTIGIVVVAAFAARIADTLPDATRTATPRDESGGDCRSHDRGSFVQRRIIICEYFHDCEIDRSAQTSDGDSIAPHFAKHRFATYSAERAIFLKRIDDAVRKYP